MKLLISLLAALVLFIWNQISYLLNNDSKLPQEPAQASITTGIPEYTGKNHTVLDNNIPAFTEEDKNLKKAGFRFTALDNKGRCGAVIGLLGPETLPTEKRGPIGMVKPSGWQIAKYDNVEHAYLYHRCHLIGFQLSGINANPLNLITGTQHMNTKGMLPLENRTADYIKQTKNHVLYKVTPLFKENELVARGVQMQAWSLEDNGKMHFNVFVHNIQPGIYIDYRNGRSKKL